MWIRSWWQLSSSLTPPIKPGVASLCVCAPFTTLSGAVILVLWQLSSGRGSLALLFFSRSFFYLLGYCEQPEFFPISSFLKRCCDSHGIQFTVVKAYQKLPSVSNKDAIMLDNNLENYMKRSIVTIDWICLDQRWPNPYSTSVQAA